jgi:hypothetical protein
LEQCNPFFDCDSFAPEWQPFIPELLLFSPFSSLQTTPPSASKEEMTTSINNFSSNYLMASALSKELAEGNNAPYWDETYGQLPVGYGADELQRSQSPDAVGNPGRPPRGVFKNQKDREETAQTRGLGACIRCRMQRIRVSCFHDQEESI